MRRTALLSVVVGAIVVMGAPVAAGGACHSTANTLTEGRGFKGPSVPMETCAYTPTILFVNPGEQITWVNEDPVGHTVTGALLSWGSDAPILPDESVSYRFDEAGVYPYYCTIHPGMAGAVVVGEVDAIRSSVEPIVDDAVKTVALGRRGPPPAPPTTIVAGISGGWALTIAMLSLGGGLALYAPMRSAISAIMRVRSKSLGV